MEQKRKIGAIRISEHVRSGIKSGRWYLDIPQQYSTTRKRQRIYLESYEKAATLAEELQIPKQSVVPKLHSIPNVGITLSEFLPVWFDKQQTRVKLNKKKAASVGKDLTYLKSLQRHLGKFPIGRITEEILETYQVNRTDEDIAPVTINSEMRTLKAILNLAVKQKCLDHCPSIEPMRETRKHIILPTANEICKIIRELPHPLQLLCRLMLETGCRPSEAVNLKWLNIEFGGAPQYYLGGTKEFTAKNDNSVRIVPLNYSLAREIELLPRSSHWVFPNKDGDGPKDNFRKALGSACRRANIKRNGTILRITPKLFRKFYSTFQAENRIDPALVQSMMGHAPGSRVTDRSYKFFSQDARRQALISLPEIDKIDEKSSVVAKNLATQPHIINTSYDEDADNILKILEKNGAGEAIRTPDPNLGNIGIYRYIQMD